VKMQKSTRWTDLQLEQIIGNLLRAGVVLAAVVVFAGGFVYLLYHAFEHPEYHTFHGEEENLKNIGGIVHEALALHSRGIIQLGLLLLVLTPISRVAFSAIGFLMEGDRMYVMITLIVLAVLLFSLFRAT
jgi:uncharacterized membrane protein